MKNFICILSLIIFTASTIKAQEDIVFGVKGGINLFSMSSDSYSDTNLQTGVHLGLLAEVSLGERFSLQPEILYSTQGTEAEVTMNGSGPRLTKYTLDYIQVPVLAKIYFTEPLSIEVGPSFNFLVNEKIDGIETDFGSSFEFGAALGASYKFRGGFFASARYIYGFTDAFDRDDRSNKTYNNGFQLGVGFLF